MPQGEGRPNPLWGVLSQNPLDSPAGSRLCSEDPSSEGLFHTSERVVRPPMPILVAILNVAIGTYAMVLALAGETLPFGGDWRTMMAVGVAVALIGHVQALVFAARASMGVVHCSKCGSEKVQSRALVFFRRSSFFCTSCGTAFRGAPASPQKATIWLSRLAALFWVLEATCLFATGPSRSAQVVLFAAFISVAYYWPHFSWILPGLRALFGLVAFGWVLPTAGMIPPTWERSYVSDLAVGGITPIVFGSIVFVALPTAGSLVHFLARPRRHWMLYVATIVMVGLSTLVWVSVLRSPALQRPKAIAHPSPIGRAP